MVKKQSKIENFPISFYSIILGLCGLVIASQKFEEIYSTIKLSNYILIFTITIFITLTIINIIKLIKYPKKVKEEFNHKIKLNFFPTISISFLLLSITILPINQIISKYLFIIGTIMHLLFTLKIITIWIHKENEIKFINPAWFIPVVGNILVPIAGIQHTNTEILWFFFSIGIIFWISLFTIFLYRIIFHKPLPEKLMPTFFILIAPPALGFISYIKLIGTIDNFARILYYFASFLTILLFTQIKYFYKIKFYLSWWAYSFPIAAITLATFLMYHTTNIQMFKYIATGLYLILISLIIFLIIKTINAIITHKICLEED